MKVFLQYKLMLLSLDISQHLMCMCVCVYVCLCIDRKALCLQFSSVAQSCPILFDPWTAAHQASLSITNSWSLLKIMSIKLVMPSNHLILCHPLLFLPSILPSIRVFVPMSQFFVSGGPSIGVSASASVLPVNIQD